MPIYEYKCEGCGSQYEQMRKMSDADSNLECPGCRSTEVKRQLSSFAAHSGAAGRQKGAPMGGGCGMGACGTGGCAFGNN
jgi:putative FmdB family regulatory protein